MYLILDQNANTFHLHKKNLSSTVPGTSTWSVSCSLDGQFYVMRMLLVYLYKKEK